MFSGLYTAVVTPFKDGKLDEASLRRILKHVLDSGSDGIVPSGTTGENPTLSEREKDILISVTKEMCEEEGAHVIAGAGTNSTYKTIKMINEAEKFGIDGVLVITPYYNKPTQDGLLLHFKEIAAETNLPIMMYNVPSRTGVNMTADTVIELSEEKNIVSLKEAGGDLIQFSSIVDGTKPGFTVLSGEDALTLPSLAVGGEGVVSVASNVAPGFMSDMLDAWDDGNIEEALTIHRKLLPLFKALFRETSPSPVKAAMEMMGLCSAEVRLPLAPVREETKKALEKALRDLELL
ncbi:4-hydroxy-tetrahydrodipicolinate synthase [bacterium]|nr:4-hydroxy-tetrahydrodipicolinate synthase [FCB group bacterium]MBL7191569.1 4-hydroxy-tetrahydrodipicolinate synthase [bacterium]